MKRNIVIAAVTAAALIGGGTATALAVTGGDGGGPTARHADARLSDQEVRDDEARDDDSGRDDDPRPSATEVTAPQAIAAALEHTPGTAVSAELDDEDDTGEVTWQVDVLSGGDARHSVRVDPHSGRVLGAQAEREDDTAQLRAALKGTSVTAAEAAKAVAGKGTVTSVDLDEEGRTTSWELETRASGGAEQDWHVDPHTGKVTADRADDSNDPDDD
ncbi:PepSY domain-containing protein [Streptomyces sp. NPDC052682]|uniref:PepSY domain-containing protein n=1 Tax=Streptomyces sp. NPDC052682 TaxID=3154954 RepID=UPI00343AC2A6